MSNSGHTYTYDSEGRASTVDGAPCSMPNPDTIRAMAEALAAELDEMGRTSADHRPIHREAGAMIPGRVSNATRVLGAPADWNEERDGWCGGLAIKDQPGDNGLNHMISAWEPTPEEQQRIASGAPVLLWVVGHVHPPVLVTVGRVPEET